MKAADPSQALAATIVDELARAGVRHACISPGARSAPLALAFDAEARIRVHVVLDERSAAFLALGIAKASGVPAAVVTTSGTAAANLHPAIIEAHHARAPVVALTADRPPELRDTGAPQTIDQTKLFGGAVRWFADPGPPEARSGAAPFWRSLAARAIAAATGCPPGPVHLNLPLREPLFPQERAFPIELEGRSEGAPWASAGPARAELTDEEAEALASEVMAASRGAVVAGSGNVASKPVHDFASAAGWPVIAEASSGLRAGPGAITTYDALLRHPGFAGAHQPDLVFRFGAAGISRALEACLTPEVPQVLIDPHGSWHDPGRAVSRLVRAEPAAACAALARRLEPRPHSPWLRSWVEGERRARTAIDDILDAEEEPSEPRTARDLLAAMPAGSALVVAASMPVRDLDWFGGPCCVRVFANRGANGIDGFVSIALGVAAAWPGPVAALAGDLSILHDQGGLLAARAGGADATLVVANNDGGGVFSFLPQARGRQGFERLFATPQGVDFRALARLHGFGYERLEHAADLGAMLDRSRRAGGLNLVEVRTDRDRNVSLHERLWDAVGRALQSD